ncbi:helix-turn-helix domain-containing protein [Paenibacillus mendelii]|uniref:Helix-turn-helix domain-containing protein n=1 Tax=Paenibacillus mendelii TaxID=206163 RepID=A0ABV6JKN3_9BACL|nr:helix-turn-helix transcriptional regulator [Paenibacillus mendelii]MCQ6564064.1 helix-turn-helix domain-containing protein [Paenibacillus mendelii]
MINPKAVGDVIVKRRRLNGMTQDELAQILNVTPQAVSKWEKGLALPDTSILPTLGFAISTSIDELLVSKAAPYNPQTDSLLFNLAIADFSFDHWEGASFIPNYSGLPQTLEPIEVDGRNSLLVHTSERPTCKRRGLVSKSAVTLEPYTVVELTFKPLGDIDGIIELWLYDRSSSNSIRVSARGGNYGEEREFISDITRFDSKCSRHVIRYNEWETFRIEIKPQTTVVSLLDADRVIIKSFYYDLLYADFIHKYHLVISQELGYPNDSNEWHMKAYIEKLQVWKINAN